MVRSIVLAVDESHHSRMALDFCLQRVVHRPISALQLHLVTVLPPAANPMPPVPMGGAMTTPVMLHAQQQQRHRDEQHAQELLKRLADVVVMDYKMPAESVKLHVLPALGGASGVGQSIVEAGKRMGAGLVVVGTRGMGYIQSSLMAFLGLGSVSDYCLHEAHIPVLVVNHQGGKDPVPAAGEATPLAPAPPPKKVLVCYDDSPHAQKAMAWFLDKVATPHDQLHLITVAMTPPMMVFEEPPAVAAAERRQMEKECEEARQAAEGVLRKAVENAQQHGVMRTKIVSSVLNPENGNSEVGQVLCQYAKDKGIGLVVIGSRGLGAWQRRLLGVLGLGSVSDYIAHHLGIPLIVVKEETDAATSATPGRPHTEDSSALLPRLDEETTGADEEKKE